MKRFTTFFFLLTLTLFFSSTNVSASTDTNETPQPIEKKSFGPFLYDAGKNTRFLPDISVIGSLAGAYFENEPIGDTGHNPARTGFNLQEIELAIQSAIDPYFYGNIFLAFHEDGVEIEEAYATTQGWLKGLSIRAGKFLLPVGRQNQKHLHIWEFVNTPLVTDAFFGTEGLSELGINVNYLFPLPFYFEIQGSFSNGDNDVSFAGTRKKDFLYTGRLITSFDLSQKINVLIGASSAFGFNASDLGNQTNIFGGDILMKWNYAPYRHVAWQSEYLLRRMQSPGILDSDGGGYSFLDWRFAKRWNTTTRFDFLGLPEGASVKTWRLSPSLSFAPTEFSRLRLQYELTKVTGTNAAHAAYLQLQFNMGPHGSHPY